MNSPGHSLCEHTSLEVVGGLGVCADCGEVLLLTGQVPVSGNRPENTDEKPTCWTCGLPAEYPGEGRYCGRCEDYEGTCANDHCMTCGSDT